jgi:ketosteroid isomerase-like protein
MTHSNPAEDRSLDLPDVIARYLDTHDRRDTDATLATFSPDATVVDEGRTYAGTDAIRRWLDTAGHEFTFTRTFIEATSTGDDTWVIRNRLTGDFPGGVADLDYRFVLADGLIAGLLIAP